MRHNRPEMSRPVGFKAARRPTGLSVPGKSASGWPTDPRGCASGPRSSASASAVVTGIADAGRIASLERCLRSPRQPIVLAVIAPPSPSGISSSHLHIQNNINRLE